MLSEEPFTLSFTAKQRLLPFLRTTIVCIAVAILEMNSILLEKKDLRP